MNVISIIYVVFDTQLFINIFKINYLSFLNYIVSDHSIALWLSEKWLF